jgi:hypothetical protein
MIIDEIQSGIDILVEKTDEPYLLRTKDLATIFLGGNIGRTKELLI